MNPRLRRLTADYQQVSQAFTDHPRIRLIDAQGRPPDRYTIEYRVTGLVQNDGRKIQRSQTHRAEVFLPIEYPRRPPFCRMVTPVFHPNIDPTKICIGDHWSAGQRLAHLLVRIGEMIAYQSYNVKSPLNGEAAAWADEHMDELPLEACDLAINL